MIRSKVDLHRYSRSSTEFDTGLLPFGVLNVRSDLIQREFEGDDPDGIRVSLSEDGSQTGDVLSDLEGKLGREDLDGLFHPFVGHGLDLFEIGGRDGGLVAEIESKLGRSDERSLLVNVVAQDFSQTEVENVRGGVVVSQRPSSFLHIRIMRLMPVSLDAPLGICWIPELTSL